MKSSLNNRNLSGEVAELQAELKERTARWRRSRFRMHVWKFTVWLSYAIKRLLDIAVASIVLFFGSPLFLLLAILVKLSSRGSALFVHTRVGYMGRHFLFYKFRSMVPNDGDVARKQEENHVSNGEDTANVQVNIQGMLLQDEALMCKIREYAGVFRAKPDWMIRTKVTPNDPKITPLGRILRKTSLDELPQFFNVLVGDMSVVGPRPPVPSEVRKYSLEDRKRLNVKPGLTCLWQIKGRSNLSFEKQLELDKEYIQSQSLLQDFLILVKTVPAIIIGRGAY